MTESELTEAAASRQSFSAFAAPLTYGGPRPWDGAALVLPLFPEPVRGKPGTPPAEPPHPWRLLIQRAGLISSVAIPAAALTFSGNGGGVVVPVVDLSQPVSLSPHRHAELLESLAIASRDSLRCHLTYQPVDGTAGPAERFVEAVGLKGNLFYVLDLNKDRALRGYRLDGIKAFRVEGPVPRWDGKSYRVVT